MKTEKKRGKNKPEYVLSHILSTYGEENSRNENSTSCENAGAELPVCTRSSDVEGKNVSDASE
jgi:hypothetical protein